MEIKDCRNIYDLSEREKTTPKSVDEKEFMELAEALFTQVTKREAPGLKINARVERLIQRMRNKSFGFTLDIDPRVNIDHIIDNYLYKDEQNRMNFLLVSSSSIITKLKKQGITLKRLPQRSCALQDY
ncbi:MAG: hypothetical protein ACW97Z_04155 [Candidatus Hodarchaeales archaeon]|jgi:hypothetical protein